MACRGCLRIAIGEVVHRLVMTRVLRCAVAVGRILHVRAAVIMEARAVLWWCERHVPGVVEGRHG